MTSPAIPASKRLDAYLKQEIAPALLAAGFKASGRVHRRPVGAALQIVDIQNWKLNDARRARFTIEVGVCFPFLLQALAELETHASSTSALAKPGITECAIRRRLGRFLEPPQDAWWTVSATTDHVPPPQDILGPLTQAALPWLQAMSTLEALASAERVEHAMVHSAMRVAACFALGRTTEGDEAAHALAVSRHPDRPDLQTAYRDALLGLRHLASAPTPEA